MEHKSFKDSIELKGSRDGISLIKGYASVFGNVDSHGDIILPGAFGQTIINAKERPIKLFSSHDMDARELIGTVTVLKEDNYGLYFEASVSQAPSAQDIALKAFEGHLDEVSIGFFIKKSEAPTGGMPGVSRLITDIELIEISLVSRASNAQAKLLEVKEESVESGSSALQTDSDIINKTCEENMTNENNNEEVSKESELRAAFEKKFEEKMAKFEEILNTPVNRTPVEVEEKAEVVETKSEAELKQESRDAADDLFCAYVTGDLSKKEYKKAMETKALSSSIVENGGALVPETLYSELIIERDRINKISLMVSNIDVTGPLNVDDYSFSPTWADHDEGDTISETSISNILGKSTLDAQDLALLIPVPKRLNRRSFRSIASLLAAKCAAADKDRREDKIFLGSGNKEPLGIVTMLTDLSVNTVNVTTNVASVDYDDLVDLTFKLKEEYRNNGAFFMHPDAVKTVMKLKDSSNLPVWTHGRAQDGVPPQLLGYPVYETRALEDGNASGESPIVFGDAKLYLMANEVNFGFEASEHSSFNKNQIDLKMIVSYDGMPLDQNGFAMIEIS